MSITYFWLFFMFCYLDWVKTSSLNRFAVDSYLDPEKKIKEPLFIYNNAIKSSESMIYVKNIGNKHVFVVVHTSNSQITSLTAEATEQLGQSMNIAIEADGGGVGASEERARQLLQGWSNQYANDKLLAYLPPNMNKFYPMKIISHDSTPTFTEIYHLIKNTKQQARNEFSKMSIKNFYVSDLDSIIIKGLDATKIIISAPQPLQIYNKYSKKYLCSFPSSDIIHASSNGGNSMYCKWKKIANDNNEFRIMDNVFKKYIIINDNKQIELIPYLSIDQNDGYWFEKSYNNNQKLFLTDNGNKNYYALKVDQNMVGCDKYSINNPNQVTSQSLLFQA